MSDGWHGLPESSRANRGLVAWCVGYHGQLEDSQTVPPGYHNYRCREFILNFTNGDIQLSVETASLYQDAIPPHKQLSHPP